ncbi:MAG: CoB--CoM heterodisulfide reductase iron-sulfur subunit A family protein [Archaeoglobales archaeon]|nr:MAG: CoB--CoM heterodisulfide reductase iron-sulfur subunit A family protein [Archaeoglobales archaeon]
MRERIGVYICHCGGNISDYVDVKKVVEAVKDLPGVAIARDFVFMCSEAGQDLIKEDIKNLNLDGVVVASCSPHLHEKTFRDAASSAGLNPYLVEHVCIREHSSWVHSDDMEGATQKAIWIVKTAIAKVSLARELHSIRLDMKREAIVVGGGIAGMRCAIDLARAGSTVHLIERSPFLGGRAAQIYKLYPSRKSGFEIVRELVEEIKRYPNIKVYTNAEVVSAEGAIGDFKVKVRINPRYVTDKSAGLMDRCPVEVPDEFNYGLTKRKAIYKREFSYPDIPVIDINACTKCGECSPDFDQKPREIELSGSLIILATGFKPYEPKEGEFGYGVYKNVITLPVFERLLALSEGELVYNGKKVRDIVFIYCVGSRCEEHEYCSRYCCVATLNASLAALEKFKDVRIYHVYRDIRAYGKYESYYEEAGRNRVLFLRFDPEEPPVVERFGEKVMVKVKDLLLGGEEIEIPADLVVLSVGMEPEMSEIFTMLRVPFSRDGFLQEVHPKLRPVETAIGGVLLAGTCQGPKDTVEATASASAAAAKANTYLIKGYAELEPFIAEIDAEKCDGCGECVEECPSGAISIKDGKAVVNEALCKGCGACGGVCPNKAINLRGYYYDQLEKMIEIVGGD